LPKGSVFRTVFFCCLYANMRNCCVEKTKGRLRNDVNKLSLTILLTSTIWSNWVQDQNAKWRILCSPGMRVIWLWWMEIRAKKKYCQWIAFPKYEHIMNYLAILFKVWYNIYAAVPEFGAGRRWRHDRDFCNAIRFYCCWCNSRVHQPVARQ